MKTFISSFIIGTLLFCSCQSGGSELHDMSFVNKYYLKAPQSIETRWVSAENPDGLKSGGGKSNKGAKGDAYTLIAPNSKKIIFNQEGSGIITKIWSANSILWSSEMRRNVIINMYWDNEEKPAVSVPFAEFFGNGLGVFTKFETSLFANPEARSHNCFIPMPYRKAAKIEIVNETDQMIMFYYKINFLKMKELPDDALYFHAFWNRNPKTTLGEDFELLPKVNGSGRYLGTHIGVIGDTIYRGTWFGEGEVKIYLDGDDKYPTLCGTGTEDYIGTGWGQGTFVNSTQGSLISDNDHCLYSFYRYHLNDPVYFHKDCRVTIQQIGNAVRDKIRDMKSKGAELKVLWSYVEKDGLDASKRYLDMDNPPKLEDDDFPSGVSTNWYRSDDVSSTTYFYLDKPSVGLPSLPGKEIRNINMEERVYKYIK